MENEELIKLCSDKAQKWLTPAYDAETQAEVKRMLENPDKTELIEDFHPTLKKNYYNRKVSLPMK
jgi:phosphoglucomutase